MDAFRAFAHPLRKELTGRGGTLRERAAQELDGGEIAQRDGAIEIQATGTGLETGEGEPGVGITAIKRETVL